MYEFQFEMVKLFRITRNINQIWYVWSSIWTYNCNIYSLPWFLIISNGKKQLKFTTFMIDSYSQSINKSWSYDPYLFQAADNINGMPHVNGVLLTTHLIRLAIYRHWGKHLSLIRSQPGPPCRLLVAYKSAMRVLV